MGDEEFLTGFHDNPVRDEFLNWWEALKGDPPACRELRRIKNPENLSENEPVSELYKQLIYYGDYSRYPCYFIGGISSHVETKITGKSFAAQVAENAEEGDELHDRFMRALEYEERNQAFYQDLIFIIRELNRTISLLSLVNSLYFWDDRATQGAWKSDFKSMLHRNRDGKN